MEKKVNFIPREDDFDRIYREYTDPLEIKKRQAMKLREQIKEDKQSSYCLE